MRPALLIGLAVAGVVATVGGVVAVQVGHDFVAEDRGEALGQVVIIDGIWIACGLVACWRRPNNLVGPLVTAFGFVDMSQELYWDAALPFTIAPLVSAFTIAIAIHLFLAYPSGRLTTAPQRALVGFAYGAAIVLAPLGAFATDPAANGCPACPPNLLFIEGAQRWEEPVAVVSTIATVAALVAAIVLVGARWRRASNATRRALGPVLLTAFLAAVLLLASVVTEAVGLYGLATPIHWFAGFPWIAIPIVFAFGLLRTQLHRGAIADLVVQLEAHPAAPELRDAMARALGDPSVELGFWLPTESRYVTADGGPFDPGSLLERDAPQGERAASRERAATVVEHDGERFAVLVHDPYLDGALVQAVGAAASMALANGRLQAALRAQLAEVRASRTRIVEAGDLERRRLERDLHDGAQQRLLGVRLALQLARSRLADGNSKTAADVLAEADAAVVDALAELRALARGIHPPILTEEGLGPALAALAGRAPLPIELSVDTGRLPPAVEATCYFVAAEATANVVKHASASRARIRVSVADGIAALVVTDDGVGGADADGAGLRGLRDRVEAVDGRFAVEAQASGGTRVSALIPCV